MAKNSAAIQRDRATNRAALFATRKWALFIAFAVSVLLHLLLGVGVSKLIGTQKNSLPPSSNDTLSLRFVAVAPKAPLVDKAKKTPEIAIPKPSPTPDEPAASPMPRPAEKVKKSVPRQRPRIEALVIPSKLPEKQAAPGTGNPLLDKKPVPLPRGSREAAQRPRNEFKTEPRIAPRRETPPLPLPVTVPDTEAGKPAASPTAIVKAENPILIAPTISAAPSAREGEGATAGNGVGRADAPIINRGIPFGDRMGIPKGGDPNGGGGIEHGAGGSAGLRRGLGRNSYVPGTPQFTLARPPRNDEGPPIHIVYVIDVSGSMEDGGKILRVRDAMEKALSELRPDDSFNIVFFADKASLFSPTMRLATASNISVGVAAVDVTEPGGATNLSAALSLAFAQSEVTHIFLMSDGEPNQGITDFEKIAALAREKNRGNAHIITLALGQGEKFKGMALLRQLAEEGHGTFHYIDLRKR